MRKCLEVLSDWERKLLKDHYESGRTDAEVGYDLLGGQGTRSARVLKAFRLRRNALQRLARLFIQGGPVCVSIVIDGKLAIFDQDQRCSP